jgi:hypothetical protein
MRRAIVCLTLVALASTGCSLRSRAIGKWSVVDPEYGAFEWVAIRRGESKRDLTFVWPRGLGCQGVTATVRDGRIDFSVGPDDAGHIVLTERSTASLTFDDSQMTVKLKKTKESAYFVCE